MSNFERASRLKLRFEGAKGQSLQTEDLWDLPLQSTVGRSNLDDVAKTIHRQMRESQEESFVSSPTPQNSLLQLQMDIVMRVIEVKKAENLARANEALVRQKNERIREIIAKKEDEQLENLGIEELQGMLQ